MPDGASGPRVARGRPDRYQCVEHLLASIEALPITASIARSHAQIWAALESRGELIGAHDLWIAATAISQGMSVATANAGEFKRVPGLAVVEI